MGYGGTEATVRNILYEMSKKGHDVYAVVGKPEIERTNQRDVKEDGITTVQIGSNSWEPAMKELINDETVVYTVLHPLPERWKKVKEMGAKVLHEYNMAHQELVTGADAYIFNSKWTKSFYPHIDGDVIFPLVDLSKFMPDDKKKEPLCVGMVNPCRAKGSVIFARLAREMPEVKFAAVGGWTHKVNNYGKLDVPNYKNVHYMGNIPSMSDFYNRIEALLVPTQSADANWHSSGNKESIPVYSDAIRYGGHGESFGRVVLEAMAHNAAVIASNKDGLPEAVADGGFLVGQFDNAAHWKHAMERVLEDIDIYRKAARRRLRDYDYEADVNRWNENFQNVLRE